MEKKNRRESTRGTTQHQSEGEWLTSLQELQGVPLGMYPLDGLISRFSDTVEEELHDENSPVARAYQNDDPTDDDAFFRVMSKMLGKNIAEEQGDNSGGAKMGCSNVESLVGCVVGIRNIKTRPELNGQRGTVTQVLSNGRCAVKLWESNEQVALKPSNIFRGGDGTVSIESTLRSIENRPTSGPWADAKSKYREAKRHDGDRVKECQECGKKDGDGCKILVCGRCQTGAWCGKECQRRAWPGHKKVCDELLKARLKESMDEPHEAKQIPRNGIALPPALTGYPKEVLILVPAWTFEEVAKSDGERADDPGVRASVLKSIKYFFKKERCGGAKFTPADIQDMCDDALIAFRIGFEGVREVQPRELTGPGRKNKKWSLEFASHTPVPKDWKMNPAKLHGVPPHIVAAWEKSIEETRAELGEW